MRTEKLQYETPSAPGRQPLGTSAFIVPLVSGFAGAATWALSPVVTGQQEAWDHFGYYVIALFIGGVVAGSCGPRVFWLAPIGSIAGQMLYAMAMLPGGPSLWLIGLVFGAVLSVVNLAGASIPFLIHRIATRGAGKHRQQSRQEAQ